MSTADGGETGALARTLEEEAYAAIARAHGLLARRPEQFLREHGLTSATYAILCILRGAAETGLTCSELARSMFTRVPDVTRLIDRLVAHEFAERIRGQNDRRVVRVTLTKAGRNLLAAIEKPLREIHFAQLEHLEPAELEHLLALLKKLQAPLEE